MFKVEIGRGGEGDEELGTVGIGSAVCHGEDVLAVMAEGGMKFILEFISRAAHSVAEGIAALYHEIMYQAVKRETVVKRAADLDASCGDVDPVALPGGEADEIGNGAGRFVVVEENASGAERGRALGEGEIGVDLRGGGVGSD